ncbi:hypothetical protein AB4232_11265 [Vibrio sp. 10N.286.46.A8]|uniref:hypothetical protein n=1 Tax=Vibrio sp. 10N.286.46.A8 TaxID=3229697 RepID=UPI00355357E4
MLIGRKFSIDIGLSSAKKGLGITLKTDVKWLRLMMEKMDERLTRLEDKSPL